MKVMDDRISGSGEVCGL